jgi:hypothetical protein
VCRAGERVPGQPESLFNQSFPEALRASLAARAVEVVWRDDDCRVFRLRPAPAR